MNANISKTKQQRHGFLFIVMCIASEYIRTQKIKPITGRVSNVDLHRTQKIKPVTGRINNMDLLEGVSSAAHMNILNKTESGILAFKATP